MNYDIFLLGLMVVSILTGLVTEAVKKTLTEYGKTYRANTLSGVIATVLSVAISVGYIVLNDVGFTAQTIIPMIALAFMGWLCAMVGYDKVVGQFKNINKGE